MSKAIKIGLVWLRKLENKQNGKILMRNSGLKALALMALLLGLIASPARVAAQRYVTVIDWNANWRYVENGVELGTAWRANAYDDSGAPWQSGFALLGNEDCGCYPVNSSTTLNLGPAADRTTNFYFRTHFTYYASNMINTLSLWSSNLVDDGCVIYLNGTEAGRIRVPAGQNAATYASGTIAAEGVIEPLQLATNLLRIGDNVLAVEVHQVSVNSSDIDFALQLVAIVPSAVAFTSQPQSQSANIGSTFTLSATVSGGPVFFQWQTNNGSGVYGNVSGATSSNYVSATLTTPATISYRLIASNGLNVATSSVAVVTVVPDTTGPLLVSATVVEEAAATNRIDLVFNETLNLFTAHSGINPQILTNGSFRVVLFGSSATLTLSNAIYVPGNYPQPGPLPKISIRMNPTNWFYRSNYYIIVNNVRDQRTNVIAPNSIIPVSWPVATNVFMPASQAWIRHDNFNGYYPDITDIYTNSWWTTNYNADPGVGWSDPAAGFFYWDQGLNGSCFSGLNAVTAGGQDQPTLFRTWFMWPTNGPTTADLKFSYSSDDAAAIYLNGSFLFSDANFPAGSITYNTRATSGTEGACKTNTVNGTLRPGSNLLAVAIAQFRPPAPGAPADAAFDFVWTMQLDAISSISSPLPPMSVSNRIVVAHPTANTTRLSWSTNAYGWALVYTTNIIHVGSSNIFQGPWLQEQPNMANPYTFTNTPVGPRRFYELFRTQ
ncbi:MAG: hypothetical protein QOF48_2911 [Verrucomicrobiota bacterium]